MSSYQQYRFHMNKYNAAYLRCSLYVLAAILPDLVSELKGYKEFADISPVNWATLVFGLMYDAVIQIAAFMDKTSSQTDTGTTATGTATLSTTLTPEPHEPTPPAASTHQP